MLQHGTILYKVLRNENSVPVLVQMDSFGELSKSPKRERKEKGSMDGREREGGNR